MAAYLIGAAVRLVPITVPPSPRDALEAVAGALRLRLTLK